MYLRGQSAEDSRCLRLAGRSRSAGCRTARTRARHRAVLMRFAIGMPPADRSMSYTWQTAVGAPIRRCRECPQWFPVHQCARRRMMPNASGSCTARPERRRPAMPRWRRASAGRRSGLALRPDKRSAIHAVCSDAGAMTGVIIVLRRRCQSLHLRCESVPEVVQVRGSSSGCPVLSRFRRWVGWHRTDGTGNGCHRAARNDG